MPLPCRQGHFYVRMTRKGVPLMQKKTQIMDAQQLRRTITRMAHEIIERNKGVEDVVLVGVRTRGKPIAEMLAEAILRVEGKAVQVGSVDITYYRDDMTHLSKEPTIQHADVPFNVENKTVVLVDDVLYTGRTARAAMDCIMDLGRARRIQLAVLIDRGHRELPIRADFAGKNIPTSHAEFVRVHMADTDNDESVWLCER